MSDFASKSGYNPENFSFLRAMDNMKAIVQKAGIDVFYFDVTPDMTFEADGHLNDTGHHRVALFILDTLNGRRGPMWSYRSQTHDKL